MIYDNITLILDSAGQDPLDISEYIMQKTNIAETPHYVNGVNQGKAKSGVSINDRVHTSYSFSVPLLPLPQSIYQQIIAKCEENEFEVTYTTARSGALLRMDAQCSLSTFLYATRDSDGNRIYHGSTITVEGK